MDCLYVNEVKSKTLISLDEQERIKLSFWELNLQLKTEESNAFIFDISLYLFLVFSLILYNCILPFSNGNANKFE